jgi:HTH-type transcriptional regulator/antitoxin HigA
MSCEYRAPTQLIEAHLHERGWTHRVLAVILGVDDQTISRILTGRKAVDAEMALTLQVVLGIDPDQLLQLQRSYDLAKAQIEVFIDPNIATRAALFGELPVAEIIKRGWLTGITDIRDADLEVALCNFFGTKSVDEIVLSYATKKTDVTAVTAAQLAWLFRVRQIAREMLVAKYSPDALLDAIDRFKNLLGSLEGASKAPHILMECGVRYVIVESLKSTNVDGVCFWLNDLSPVIGMSLRLDRIDNFWFVLRHEIEHVLRQHGRAFALLDIELEKGRAGAGSNIPEEERVANEAAVDFCVPQSSLEHFIARKSPSFTDRDIFGFAKTLSIHPGLVAGQLQHRTGRYDLFANHLVRVRSAVRAGALVDGWGEVAHVGL